ncbi:MAG: extracellular solute-binding protein [Actinobacteria bacterium]|nr:extracellular solute-binding protein [Actinomycetota bacterium]
MGAHASIRAIRDYSGEFADPRRISIIGTKLVVSVGLTMSAALMLAACGSTPTGTSSAGSTSASAAASTTTTATGSAEVFSSWTSGSESAALQSLFAAAKSANPSLELVNGAVAGGAGVNSKQVLATRLAAGDVPETWKTNPGSELGDFVKQGVVADLTGLYASEGWDKVVPKELIDSMSYAGKTYAALTGVHRANVLWYNKPLVEGAGVTVPANITFANFATIAAQLKSKGITPLCLGDKDIWTAAQLLEEIVVGEIDADGWNGLMDGTLSWNDPKVVQAVSDFSTALTWTNKDHKSLDWTGAVAGLADGTCAFNLMGDWAYGELTTKHNKIDGTDFGYTVIGDPNTFVTVSDAFVEGVGSKNPAGAVAFLKALMTPEGQIAFNKLKGSSPVRSDVDLSQLGVYQQGAAKTLADGVKVASLVHGQALVPAADSQALADNVAALEATGNATAFSAAMAKAFKANAG